MLQRSAGLERVGCSYVPADCRLIKAQPACKRAARTQLNTQALAIFGGAESKCPVARLVNGNGQLSTFDYDYEPFTAPFYQKEYRMTMGLVPMHPDNWIEIDAEYEADIELRRKLLAEQRDIVIQTTPQADEANREMLDLLVDYLPRRYPDRFHLTETNEFINVATGDAFNLDDPNLDSLETVALLIQEDMCLMVPDEDGDLRFVSGLVLFPQRWSLMEKIGMDMHRIHVPVPLFEKSIENSVAAFLKNLVPGKPFWRCNWTVSDNPEKFQPLVEEDIALVNAGETINDKWLSEPITAENAGERLCTRMERETFSRFPKTRAVLFSIRTHMKPLSDFERKPESAAQLARALRNLHPDITQYKTVSAFKEQALAYLDKVAAKALVAA